MFIKCCVGGDLTLVPALQRALIGAQQVGGENWVACDGDKIVAFAGWFGPGQALLNRSVSLHRPTCLALEPG